LPRQRALEWKIGVVTPDKVEFALRVLDIVLGIIGALAGGYLFDLFGASGVTGLNIYSMVVAVVGSIVVLAIYNMITGPRHA
jgi:uncharacterized membrane protein YeaQ/YmgE (transglycosylase-associated protein family)